MSGPSLLPKSAVSFADTGYWRQFFKSRGEKVFEWYGSYSEIGQHLEKYLKPNDRILQIGCGNSTLADDLYDNGFRRIVSVDIVEDVIKRQLDKNRIPRPDLEFYVADITNSGLDADSGPLQTASYQVVLDKGTLDALLPPDFTQDQRIAVKRMFNEMDRILAIGGRYLIVTLAQPEVIRLWLMDFENRPYILRIHQLNSGGSATEDGWKLPTFLLVATKLKPPAAGGASFQMFEYLNSGHDAIPRRMANADDLLDAVQGAQEYSVFCDKAKNKRLNEELRIELHGSNASSGPRYVIYLTSCHESGKKFAHPYAIFVVPQGREHEWLFSTPKGRQELSSQASARRLAVVHLGRDHEFANMEAVKEELNQRVMDFAPADVSSKTNHQIPYLSLGDDLGRRTLVHKGESECSGQFVVEDVSYGRGKDAPSFRRLVFMKSQNLIQSEARLNPKSREIDWTYLSCAHHRIMLAALAVPQNKETLSICIIGLGGGCLATFIWKHFPKMSITTVELDPTIVHIANDYFGFPKSSDDQRLNCIIGDGLEYISIMSATKERYDVILLDVAGPSHVDGISCPLPAFVEDEYLAKLRNMLEPDGVLAFNLVTRDADKRSEITTRINHNYPHVIRQSVEGELNEVLLCLVKAASDDRIKGFQSRLKFICDQLAKKCGWSLLLEKSINIEDILDKLSNL